MIPADVRPLPLKEAAERYGFTVSTLRAEAQRGRLRIFRIGRKDYTLSGDVLEMIHLCREDDPRRGSTTTKRAAIGSSEMAEPSFALVSLMGSLPKRSVA